jgi:hypothetical protein
LVAFFPFILEGQTQDSIIITGSIEARRVTVTRADLDKLPKHTVNVNSTNLVYEASPSKICWNWSS